MITAILVATLLNVETGKPQVKTYEFNSMNECVQSKKFVKNPPVGVWDKKQTTQTYKITKTFKLKNGLRTFSVECKEKK